jgi:hypothetical protein
MGFEWPLAQGALTPILGCGERFGEIGSLP